MPHVTKVIREEQPNDECVCVTVRCDDDSTTDSTLTIFAVQTLTADEINAQVDAFHNRVALKHAAMIAGRTFLRSLIAQTKDHPDLPLLPSDNSRPSDEQQQSASSPVLTLSGRAEAFLTFGSVPYTERL